MVIVKVKDLFRVYQIDDFCIIIEMRHDLEKTLEERWKTATLSLAKGSNKISDCQEVIIKEIVFEGDQNVIIKIEGFSIRIPESGKFIKQDKKKKKFQLIDITEKVKKFILAFHM